MELVFQLPIHVFPMQCGVYKIYYIYKLSWAGSSVPYHCNLCYYPAHLLTILCTFVQSKYVKQFEMLVEASDKFPGLLYGNNSIPDV